MTENTLHVNTRTALNGADFPAVIKALQEAGCSIAEIAFAVQVSRSTVYRWRSGVHRPSLANYDKLSDAINQYSGHLYARKDIREPRTAQLIKCVERAVAAMETDNDRRVIAALIESMNADLDARIPARIAGTDPFALVRDPNEMEIPF